MCPVPHKSLMIDSFFHVFGQRPLPFTHSAINFNANDKTCMVWRTQKLQRKTAAAAYDVQKQRMFVTQTGRKKMRYVQLKR